MWEHLKSEQKDKYKTLITNFASLSQAFSQKAESEDEGQTENYVAPIVNSKFQETVFQKAFNAVGEDIANTSYDASVVVDENHKYLVGIKSFGINSGDQKIAQFKKDSQSWTDLLGDIKFHADIAADKESADKENYQHQREKILRFLSAKRLIYQSILIIWSLKVQPPKTTQLTFVLQMGNTTTSTQQLTVSST